MKHKLIIQIDGIKIQLFFIILRKMLKVKKVGEKERLRDDYL